MNKKYLILGIIIGVWIITLPILHYIAKVEIPVLAWIIVYSTLGLVALIWLILYLKEKWQTEKPVEIKISEEKLIPNLKQRVMNSDEPDMVTENINATIIHVGESKPKVPIGIAWGLTKYDKVYNYLFTNMLAPEYTILRKFKEEQSDEILKKIANGLAPDPEKAPLIKTKKIFDPDTEDVKAEIVEEVPQETKGSEKKDEGEIK